MTKSSLVVIGCKLPTGLLLEIGSPGSSGYRRVLLKGANEGLLRNDGLFIPQTVGGFGRTEVPAEFWEAWKAGAGLMGEPSKDVTREQATAHLKAQRREYVEEMQAKGVLFVADSPDLALAQSNEKASVKTGFEGLDPSKTPGDIKADADALAARQRENFGATKAA